MNDIILYTTEDGRSQIQLRTENQTVWLTQLEMAELFDATKQNISLHLKNLFEDGELDEAAVVKESLTTEFFCSSFSLNMLFICKLIFCFVELKSSTIWACVSQTVSSSTRTSI